MLKHAKQNRILPDAWLLTSSDALVRVLLSFFCLTFSLCFGTMPHGTQHGTFKRQAEDSHTASNQPLGFFLIHRAPSDSVSRTCTASILMHDSLVMPSEQQLAKTDGGKTGPPVSIPHSVCMIVRLSGTSLTHNH